MNEIIINEKISYIKACEQPLSADIGIIRDGDSIWLYDVGMGEESFSCLPREEYRVVLSHFHTDHVGNIERVNAREIFASAETCRHIRRGTVVRESLQFGNVRIFPLPSSHAQGSLGLEVDGQYAFVGDGIYSKDAGDWYVFNVQLLQAEIETLKGLKAAYLLVSHCKGLVRSKEEVISALEMIYRMRKPNDPFIYMKKR